MNSKYFSNSYIGAQTKFRKYVKEKGGKLDVISLNGEGSNKEDLSIDVAYFGEQQNPDYLFIHTTGFSGVGEFTGSAVQCYIIDKMLPTMLPNNCGICFIHIGNPYGASFFRRNNETGVDLNRNFKDVYDDLPENTVYDELNEYINPVEEPSWWSGSCLFGAIKPCMKYTYDQLKVALAVGQTKYPFGLFYTGVKLEEGPEKLLLFLRIRFSGVKRTVILNVHTGSGLYGESNVTIDDNSDETLKNSVKPDINDVDAINATYEYEGTFYKAIKNIYKDSDVYWIKQEFGTYSGPTIFHSMRKENFYHTMLGVRNIKHDSKKKLFKAFNPNDEDWQQAVLEQSVDMFKNAGTFLHCGMQFTK